MYLFQCSCKVLHITTMKPVYELDILSKEMGGLFCKSFLECWKNNSKVSI